MPAALDADVNRSFLRDVLDRNGGRYETTLAVADRLREQARICAEVSGDEEMARIAGLPEVTISLEHLRDLDLGTRIVCGYELGDFTDAERGRLPRDEGPVGPPGSSRAPSTLRTRGENADTSVDLGFTLPAGIG